MAECPFCHQDHPSHLKFCPQTGNWLDVRACPRCGRQIDRQLNFCPHCGQALEIYGASSGASPLVTPHAAPAGIHHPGSPPAISERQADLATVQPVSPLQRLGAKPLPALIIGGGLLLMVIVAASVWLGSGNAGNQPLASETGAAAVLPAATVTQLQFSPTAAIPTLPETTIPGYATLLPVPPTESTGGVVTLPALPTTPSLSESTVSEIPGPANAAIDRAPSPYSGWVVYAYGIDTEREIFITDPDSGTTEQITRNSVRDQEPAFAPDGWRLAYSSIREPDGWQIFGYDLETETEWQITLTEDMARFPNWSPVPGDERIAFQLIRGQSNPYGSLGIVLSDGRFASRVTPSGPDGQPVWSPDGSALLFGRALQDTAVDGTITTLDNWNLHQMRIADGAISRLTHDPGNDDFSYSWSPDGKQIVFASVRSDANEDGKINLDDSRDLYVLDLESGRERLLDLGGKFTFGPRWSPDGKQILFGEKVADNSYNYWLYNLESEAITRLFSKGPYFHANWVP